MSFGFKDEHDDEPKNDEQQEEDAFPFPRVLLISTKDAQQFTLKLS